MSQIVVFVKKESEIPKEIDHWFTQIQIGTIPCFALGVSNIQVHDENMIFYF